MRRPFGFALVAAGLLALSLVGWRYAMGALRADRARQEWYAVSARQAVARVRSAVALHERAPAAPGEPVARLVIPKIDLDEIVLEGVDDDELSAGPGHVPGSSLPGEDGNAVFSAHRDRHFQRFDRLAVGDRIATEANGRVLTWVVVAIRVVDKNARALLETPDATLTLTTCWPIRFIGTAPERLIVTAKPIGPADRAVRLARVN